MRHTTAPLGAERRRMDGPQDDARECSRERARERAKAAAEMDGESTTISRQDAIRAAVRATVARAMGMFREEQRDLDAAVRRAREKEKR